MHIRRIINLKNIALSSLLLAGTSSCIQKPYVEMPKENISTEIQSSLDSLVNETSKIKSNANYKLYGRDTLLLWNDFNKKPARYMKNINQKAADNVPNTVVDKKTVLIPSKIGNTTVMRQHVKVIRKPDYIEVKAVIPETRILTRDSTVMYIPVEYYGKNNPEVKEKKFNKK